jgi:hypothetical protein
MVMGCRAEKQLDRLEGIVAEIVEAVRKLHDGQTAAGAINGRLKRFLERRNRR